MSVKCVCGYLVNTVCVSVCVHGELKEYYTLGLIGSVCSSINCASECKVFVCGYLVNTVCVSVCVQ